MDRGGFLTYPKIPSVVSGLGHLFKGIIGKMSQSHILGLRARAGEKNFPIFIPWPAAHLAATGEPRAGERAEGQRLLRARPAAAAVPGRRRGGGCRAAAGAAAPAEGRQATSTTVVVLWCKAGGGCRRTWLLM